MKEETKSAQELANKALLEKYFCLAVKFDNGLNDVQLDKLFTVEEEILRRMKKDEI